MNESQIGNSELISTVNSRLVLQAVRALQPTFRAEVARKTRLKPATVTGIVTELLDQQLLREAAAVLRKLEAFKKTFKDCSSSEILDTVHEFMRDVPRDEEEGE